MSTLAVRFDEELSVAHLIADGFLPCPRAVVETVQRERIGALRFVRPCGREWGHDGPCRRRNGDHTASTVCGLSLADLPFVIAPDGLPVCPDCSGSADEYVEEAMFA